MENVCSAVREVCSNPDASNLSSRGGGGSGGGGGGIDGAGIGERGRKEQI